MIETMTLIKSMMRKLYIRAKSWLNYCLSRIIDLCDMILMDAYRLPWPAAQSMAKHIARCIGDVSWLVRAFPRLSAYRLIGADWTIIFVGGDVDLLEVSHLFFEEKVDQQELGKVALWQLSAQAQQWLAEGVDLVVCELGRIHPRSKATFTFTVPIWIQQILTLPEPLESFLSGRHIKSVRHNLNRAQKAGFSWYFSKSKKDFDHFHYNMYLPYIRNRHEERALIAPYKDQWQRWFVRGGLIVVTQNDARVGGLLCYVKGDTCFAIEVGVLGGDPDLIGQGIKISSDWFAINWAYQQGARTYDMGGTRPWRSDGVFIYKSRWRAKVVRRRRIYGVWTFIAQNLSPALRDHINRLGFISEIDGKFYGVLLNGDTDSTETDVNQELLAVGKQGLDGLVIISADSKPIIHNLVSQSPD
jgi:hypothetical protein